MTDETFIFDIKPPFLRIGNKIINTQAVDCIEYYLSGHEKHTIAISFSGEKSIRYTFTSEKDAKDFFDNVYTRLPAIY